MPIDTSDAPPAWVVFDIGRVLVEWSPERVFADALPDAMAREAFFRRTGLEATNLEADRSGDLEGKIAALARAHPSDAALIGLWWSRWTDMCHAPIPETGAFLRRLRNGGVPVCALSNFADDTFEIARRLYPVLTEFDAEVISGREGVIKPDERIYALAEARTGVHGEELFFIDDSPKNIAAAAARGWRTHLFQGWSGLSAILPEMGLDGYA